MLAITAPLPTFVDRAGAPLDGSLYIGVANDNPITAPLTVYWDSAGTQPAAQPLTVSAGVIVNGSTPAQVYIDSDYSLTLLDRRGVLALYAKDSSVYNLNTSFAALVADLADPSSASKGDALLAVKKTGTGTQATTQHEINDREIDVFDFLTSAQRADVLAEAYTLDLQAAITAADAAAAVIGNCVLTFREGGYRVNSALTRTAGVTWRGRGALSTTIKVYHNGIAVQAGGGTTLQGDFAGIEHITIEAGPSFTPSIIVYNYGVNVSHMDTVRLRGGTIGLKEQHVLNSTYREVVSECATGHQIVDTSIADPVNANTYINFRCTSGNTTAGTHIKTGFSYNNRWIGGNWENGNVPIRVESGGSGFVFITPYFEGNTKSVYYEAGAEGVTFVSPTNISGVQFIDQTAFAGKKLTIRGLIDNINAGVIQHPEVEVNGTVVLASSGYSNQQVVSVGHGWGDAASTFSYQPNNAAGGAFSGQALITPFGGPIGRVKNFVDSQDMANAAQWIGGTAASGATDPYGGTSAFTLAGALVTHQTSAFGAAATGRTFTAQVWVYCSAAGVLLLAAGTTTADYKKIRFRLKNSGAWVLLSATFTAPTDAATSGIMSITKESGTIIAWRPCFFESATPHPAIAANRDLTAIVLPMEVRNQSIFAVGTSAPGVGAWAVGDQVINTAGTVGAAKGWTCTTAPLTFTSQGNL